MADNRGGDEGRTVIYVKAFWHKAAKKLLRAEHYGKDAFRIVIREKKSPKTGS